MKHLPIIKALSSCENIVGTEPTMYQIHKWMFKYIKNMRCVCKDESVVLETYLSGKSSSVEIRAATLLIADTLVLLKLDKDQIKDMKEVFPGNHPRRIWSAYFRALLSTLAVENKFKSYEVDFLVELIWTRYRLPYTSGDKKKSFGPFNNKTFWSEVTFQYNIRFPERMRSVVALRNKMKGLLQYPPKEYVEILNILRSERQARMGTVHQKSAIFDPPSPVVDFSNTLTSESSDMSDLNTLAEDLGVPMDSFEPLGGEEDVLMLDTDPVFLYEVQNYLSDPATDVDSSMIDTKICLEFSK